MTGLAPAPASLLRVRRHATGEELALDPAWEVGAGGEARVFALPGGASVAKLYREPTLERAQKLTWMTENPPALPPGGAVSLAWPAELLTDARGWLAGFVMPRAEGARVFELYNPVTRRKAAPLFHWGLMHRAGANLAAAFDAVHAAGYVVGDVNESNLLVSPDGAVTVVDTDSFQVRGQRATFRSRVGKAEFTPPELQGARFGEVDRAPEHDRFGLAVLLFLLLMEGTHPFAARFGAGEETPTVEERIGRGLFPYVPGDAAIRPPRLAPRFEALHPAVRALFVTAFVDGHADPAARPSAAEWRAALEEAEDALAVCDLNPQHRFGAHAGACPWCARARLLRGRDPFPASEEAARTAESPSAGRPDAPTEAAPARAPVPAPAQASPPPAAAPLPGTVGQGLPPDGILGPSGVQHPASWLAPAMVLLVFGPPGVRLLGVALAALSLIRLGTPAARPVERVTVGASLLLVTQAAFLILLARVGTGTYTPDPPVPPPQEAPAPPEWELPPPLVEPAAEPEATVPMPWSEVVLPAPQGPPPDEGAGLPVPGSRPAELLNPDEANQAIRLESLRAGGIAGDVSVAVRVRADGSVAGVEVRTAPNTAFVEPALRVAERMRFRPATVDGKAVESQVRVHVRFRPGTAP
ncbi:MAG TPA: TonB family protein [Longimicrobium sp.]|nr:TonB family protein [Longimicrobium sp.]